MDCSIYADLFLAGCPEILSCWPSTSDSSSVDVFLHMLKGCEGSAKAFRCDSDMDHHTLSQATI